MLLVFEDTQWIDPSSSALIETLIEQLHELPILLLITSREGHGIRVDAVADAPRITLSRLKHADCHGIIETVCQDRTLPESVVAAILAKTDGVPLFVEELTRTIIESGLLQEHGDRFALQSPLDSMSIPVTIQDSLMARLDRLATVKDLAQTGSVIGREFSHELLKAVAAISDEKLLSGLGRLIDAGLITERRRAPDVLYVFNHALVQETAYHSLLDSRRRQLHGRIADELIAGFPAIVSNQPEWLAYHLDKAGRQRPAIEYWQRAAEQARNRSAMQEALSLLGTALEALDALAEDDDYERLRFELLTLKITPLISVEGYSTENLEALYLEAIPLYQQLEATVDLYPLLFARWVRHLNRGMMTDALTQAEEVVRFAAEHNNALMQALGQRLSGAVRVMHLHPQQGCSDLECVLETVDEQASNELGFTYGQDFLVAAHVNLAIGYNTIGRMRRGQAAAERALERTEQLNHGLARAFTGGHLGLMAEMTGDVEGLARWHLLIHEALQHESMTAWVHVGMGLRGALRYHQRALEESESLLTRCLNATEAIGNAKAQWSGSVCNGAFLLAAAGELDGCTELTTYWSLVETLDEFPELSVNRNSYDRCSFDHQRKRFSGGGVSASIDLALELVKVLRGEQAAELASLLIQYAPNPSVDTGDPIRMNNPDRINMVRQRQQELLIEPVQRATRALLDKT